MRITFRFKYPLAQTMMFEKEHHKNLRFTLSEKRELLRNAVSIWMLVDGKLVGETYGIPSNADRAEGLRATRTIRATSTAIRTPSLVSTKGRGTARF